MSHLSEEHLLELLEGNTAEAGHLDTCVACRERFEALRHTLGLLRDDPVPEPSPLFWQHLSDRVRLAIDGEAVDRRLGTGEPAKWWLQRSWRWGAAAAAVVALVAAFVVLTSQRTDRPENIADRSNSIGSPRGDVRDDLNWTIPADESWAMMAGIAEGLDFETAADAGLVVRPGSVDQVLLSLSDEERKDLAGIIQAELDRSPL